MPIICLKNKRPVKFIAVCGICRLRRGCGPYQLHIQPELPLVFRKKNTMCLETQDHVKDTLDNLTKEQYSDLFHEAVSHLPPDANRKQILIRLKMFELLRAGDRDD